MPKNLKTLPKNVECPYCETTIYVFPDDGCRRLPGPQAEGRKARNEHLKTCPKAPKIVQGRAGGAHTAERNCPVCLKEMRADHIARHIASKHPVEAILATPLERRKEAIALQTPIAICCTDKAPGTVASLRTCLACGKGCLDTCVLKSLSPCRSVYWNIKREDHAPCGKEWDKFKELFESQEYEPFAFGGTGTHDFKRIIEALRKARGDEEPEEGEAPEEVSEDDIVNWIEGEEKRNSKILRLVRMKDVKEAELTAKVSTLEKELETAKTAPAPAPENTVVYQTDTKELQEAQDALTAEKARYEELKSAALEREAELEEENEELSNQLFEVQKTALSAKVLEAVAEVYGWDPSAEPEPTADTMVRSLLGELKLLQREKRALQTKMDRLLATMDD
jgi:hypothetical protein